MYEESKEDKIIKLNVDSQIQQCNTVVNTYLEYKEVCIYKKPFTVRKGEQPLLINCDTGEVFKKIIDRSSLLVPDEDGNFTIKDGRTLQDILTSGKKSSNRALANFYGYALSNFWRYFLTITIDSKYDRQNDKFVKRLYSKFSQNICRKFPSAKILCKPERHDSGELHFHCLLADLDLSPYLTKYYNRMTMERKYSKCGQPLFTLDLFKYGFTTLAIIPKDDNISQVANYLVKYMSKGSSSLEKDRYQKRFYHTRNLMFKDKFLTKLPDTLIRSLDSYSQSSDNIIKSKDNDYITVYKIYNERDKNIDFIFESDTKIDTIFDTNGAKVFNMLDIKK